METNENGNKRVLILVYRAANAGGYSRSAKSFQTEQGTLDYALEGDALLNVFEGLIVYRMTRGARSGLDWSSSIAESYLYYGAELEKSESIDMCVHEDKEGSKAFINSLVDYGIGCRAEQETEL